MWLSAVQKGKHLPESVKQQAWITMSDIVLNRSAAYFKKSYRTALHSDEVHLARIALFQDFMVENWGNRTVQWLVSAYKRRFAMFEAYRQLTQELHVPCPGSLMSNTNGTRILRDYNRYVRLCKELGQPPYKADVVKIALKFQQEQLAKGYPKCGEWFLLVFMNHCHLYKTAFYHKLTLQFDEGMI
jgi:hypothetical protein